MIRKTDGESKDLQYRERLSDRFSVASEPHRSPDNDERVWKTDGWPVGHGNENKQACEPFIEI